MWMTTQLHLKMNVLPIWVMQRGRRGLNQKWAISRGGWWELGQQKVDHEVWNVDDKDDEEKEENKDVEE